MRNSARVLRWLRRAARAAIAAFPRSFRARYGTEMAEVYVDTCLESSRGRPGRLLLVSMRTLLAMVRAGLRERFGNHNRPHYRIPEGRSPRPRESLLSGLIQDLKFSFRALTKRPGFTLLVVGMLALGVAANAAIFSGVNSVLLRPMPFQEPDRLVVLDEIAPEWGLESVSISYPNFHHWNEDNRTFESMAVYDTRSFNLAVDGRPDRIGGALVHWRLLHVLGLEPVIGRDFTAQDWVEGAQLVTLVSERFWRERLGGSPDALGSTVRFDSREHTVIGVYPDEAVLPQGVEAWTLLTTIDGCCELSERQGSWWLAGIGRLRPDVTLEQALADLRAVHAGLVDEYGGSREVATPRLDPLHELLVEQTRPMLLVMLGAVALLLLIACGNVAGMMLARAAGRGREIGIRTALGAGRGRIVRQLLTESLMLSVVGGALGVLLGHVAMQRLVAAMPERARGWVRIEADWRIFAFAVGIAALTALVFGLAPALYASRRSAAGALQEGAVRGSAGGVRRRALSGLVVAEVALAVVLLVGAGLLLGAFRTLTERDPGFRTDPVTYSVSLPEAGYPDEEATTAFWQRLIERTGALPGVDSAGLTTIRPLAGHTGYFFAIEDGLELPEDEPAPVVLTRFATPAYLETMGVTFLRGGPYEEADALVEDEPFGIVVNESFARTFWGEVDVLGRRVRTGGDAAPWLTITGVIRDTRHYGPDRSMRPGVFLPYWTQGANRFATMAMRGDGLGTADIMPAVREIVRDLDSDVPIFSIGSMEDHLEEYLWGQRMFAALLGGFAAAALLLALGGIYSTVSYSVNERRIEIGIRMALGAQRRRVLREVVRSGMTVAATGLAIGLGAAWLLAGVVASNLEGAQPREPSLYLGVAGLLLAAALGANVLPARRAAGTEPVTAMRTD